MGNLNLRYAEQQIERFGSEQHFLQLGPYEDMDCSDCDAFLQLGIDAFRWLVRADETIRHRELVELSEFDENLHQAIEAKFRAWLGPCAFAHQWVDLQHRKGFQLENLREFSNCENEVRSIVAHLDSDCLTEEMENVRDAALEEHRRGETAEFV